jgi:hypothetical protein
MCAISGTGHFDDAFLALEDHLLGDALHAAGLLIGVHAGVVDQEVHRSKVFSASSDRAEVGLGVLDIDVEIRPLSVGSQESKELTVTSARWTCGWSRDVERASAGMGVEVEDADLTCLSASSAASARPLN